MAKYQPHFNFDSLEEQSQDNTKKRPHDTAIFIAYIKMVAPELITSDHPIHKVANGYATNNSPWTGVGQFVFDVKNSVIIHRHKSSRFTGNRYEDEITQTLHRVEYVEDRAIVH